MTTYHATALREGSWWVVTVDGVGVTQASSLDQAREWAQDLVTTMTGEAHPTVHLTPYVPGIDLDQIASAQAALAEAEKRIKEESRTIRQAARMLTKSGLTQKDTAALFGVSRQRIQQLLTS